MVRIDYKEGEKVGQCFFVREAESVKNKRMCFFKCKCGKEFRSGLHQVKKERTRSCGCLNHKWTKHGFCVNGKTALVYQIYKGIIQRTGNPNNPVWEHYGGRGIKMAKSWLGEEGFNNFLRDMGPRPSRKHSVERRNNNKGYGPKNCYWGTRKEQMQNTRTNKYISYHGEKLCCAEWARKIGLSNTTLCTMLKVGHSFADIVNWKKSGYRYFSQYMTGSRVSRIHSQKSPT
jgi:hypothetical protein